MPYKATKIQAVSSPYPEVELNVKVYLKEAVLAHNLESFLDPFLEAEEEHSHEAKQTYPDEVEHIHEVTEHNRKAVHSYLVALDPCPEAASNLYQEVVVNPNLEDVFKLLQFSKH